MKDYKKPGPVVYIDPSTNLPKCNPIICADKFNEYFEIKETNYKWIGGPVVHKFYYSICNDCGTRTITNNDKKRTDESYKRGTNSSGVDPDVKEMLDGRQEA